MASTLAHSIFIVPPELENSLVIEHGNMKADAKYDPEGNLTAVATADLIQRLIKKDEDALAELYDTHARLLMSVIMGVLKNKDEAEDILQECFIAIYNKANMYRSHLGKPTSWMVTIARNKAYDRYRKLVRQSDGMAYLKEEYEVRQDVTDSGETIENDELIAKVNTLNTDQRTAIKLVFYEGMTHQEAAEKLNTPLGTVKARIRRGLLKLKQNMSKK